ncbi:MAG: hypothetical protein GY765_15385 [bacterium]|nr:hypothetical protein [bacterium]
MLNKSIFKLFLFFMLCMPLLQMAANNGVRPKILKVSDNEFVLTRIENNSLKLEGFECLDKPHSKYIITPQFPEKELTKTKMSPMGEPRTRSLYRFIGKVKNDFYFIHTLTRKVVVYNQASKKMESKIVLYPKLIGRIDAVGDSLLISAHTVLFLRVRVKCEDKYFIKKSISFDDQLCFGTGKDMMAKAGSPFTVVFDKGKKAGIYFPKGGEFSFYNTEDGSLVDKYVVPQIQITQSAKLHRAKLFFSFGCPGFLKVTEESASIFQLVEKRWVQKERFQGNYIDCVVTDKFVILLTKEGEIVAKKKNY